MGQVGQHHARVLYLIAGDRQIRLSGALNDKGTTGTAGVVGAVALLPVAGFFMTGTSAKIPVGTPVKAFLDEDVPVAFVNASLRPLVVPAADTMAAASAAPPAQSVAAVTPAALVRSNK